MKNNTLLLLASLAVLTISASAASTQLETDLVVLPTYVVEAPRHQPVERQINASLNELRQQAQARFVIAPELPLLKARVSRSAGLPVVGQNSKSIQVAKL